jgi:DNA-binding winged helix-turn-helix (wHTH) protein
MSIGANGRLTFGDYELDSHAGKLLRDGLPVKIQPQPFRVLTILLERPGEIVSREQLRERIWGDATFVEFDQGLNYCIRQVRLALRDGASEPAYIETLPKQGYRFIAPVSGLTPAPPRPEPPVSSPVSRKWIFAATGAILVIALGSVYAFFRARPAPVRYTQLTDFIDSAASPALSPDGHMVAFFRGNPAFLTPDQVWVKILPSGEARQLTDDPRPKYGLAFSPDGSQVFYTAIDGQNFVTITVPVLGGDSRLYLENAAGLTWLDPNRLLFSAIRAGQHMGVVTSPVTAPSDRRELYFPSHERAMAHYSYASPDRKRALVVQMDEKGGWAPCLIISFDGSSAPGNIGPAGACTSAGWSPGGEWMYFNARIAGQSHLWRQRFPNGNPEQLTYGPAEEEGIAIEPDGRSLITSAGIHESSLWIHDERGDRSLSSEGEIANSNALPPSFSPDGKTLYYRLRRRSANPVAELWRVNVEFGASEAILPGINLYRYDVSEDGRQVVYETEDRGTSQLWLASVSRDSPPKRIAHSGENTPRFGPNGQIFFRFSEGNFNYLGRMNQDGSGRSKVFGFPINEFEGMSPGKRWVNVAAKRADGRGVGEMAIPLDGGSPVLLCSTICWATWSPDGNLLYIPIEFASRKSPGRSLAIPVGPAEALPKFPPQGIAPGSDASVIPGARIVNRAGLAPSSNPSRYAYVNSTMHRNLYRISLP